jgi:hypothetical protein
MRAVGVGTATITATCEGVPATAQFTVIQALSVAIDDIFLGGTTTGANTASIAGTIDVVASYTLISGVTATKLELLLSGSAAASQSLTPSSCTSCTIALNTAAFNTSSGAAAFANGARALTARLTLSDNSTIVSDPVPVTFNNVSGFIASLVVTNPNGPTSAVNPTTQQTWIGGTVALSLLPVSYTANQTITSVTGTFFGRTFANVGLTGSVFSITFPSSGTGPLSIAGYQSPSGGDTPGVTSSSLNGGGAGPTQVLNLTAPPPGNPAGSALGIVRLDNAPPSAPAIGPMPLWINNGFTFATSAGVTPGTDLGVGGVVSEFWAGANLPAGCDVTGLTRVTVGSDLAESSSPTYRGRALSRDRLGNASCGSLAPNGVAGGPFGVDLAPPFPTIAINAGPMDGSAWQSPPPAFVFQLGGSSSGFPTTNPLHAKLVLTAPGGTTCIVGTGATCNPSPSALNVISNNGTQGYYQGEFFATDAAGNSTPTTKPLYLFDAIAPSVTQVLVPGSIVGNAISIFSVTASDNVDLRDITGVMQYTLPTGGGSINFEYPVRPIGTFGLPLETAISAAPYNVPQTMKCLNSVKLTSAVMRVSDQAGHSTTFTQPIPAAQVQNCSLTVASFAQTTPNTSTISLDGASDEFDQATWFAQAFVLGGGPNPFQRVEYWWQDANGNYHFWGLAGPPTFVDFGSGRLFSYPITFDPATPIPLGTIAVIAVGVEPDGDAIGASPLTFTIIP